MAFRSLLNKLLNLVDMTMKLLRQMENAINSVTGEENEQQSIANK